PTLAADVGPPRLLVSTPAPTWLADRPRPRTAEVPPAYTALAPMAAETVPRHAPEVDARIASYEEPVASVARALRLLAERALQWRKGSDTVPSGRTPAMLVSLRTYRLLATALAFSLLLTVATPLVRH